MRKSISCEYNMDNGCVELKYADGSIVSICCSAVEETFANNVYQRSELDYLIYNDPLAYAELILNGKPEDYLRGIEGVQVIGIKDALKVSGVWEMDKFINAPYWLFIKRYSPPKAFDSSFCQMKHTRII